VLRLHIEAATTYSEYYGLLKLCRIRTERRSSVNKANGLRGSGVSLAVRCH